MIQFTLSPSCDVDKFELRSGSLGGNTASKPPIIVHRDQIAITLMCLLRAAQMEVH